MTRRYHPNDPRSAQLRCHAQTAGCSLTAQQPLNNVVRTTIQALAAVLGGTQSLHTNSMDETLALPTEEAVKLALRTQQIIAQESEVASSVDPLGGSYYVETLTNRLEEAALEYFRQLDSMGGMVKAIEQGYPQQEILDASQRYQREVERGERKIVGVNQHVEQEHGCIPTLKIGPEVEQHQVAHLSDLRKSRDSFRMAGAVEELQEAASCGENVMPYLIEAVKAKATLGEICSALQEIYGAYHEPVVL
jgi:methylmalonyl-CoA mutase N-terminal domain/subunit